MQIADNQRKTPLFVGLFFESKTPTNKPQKYALKGVVLLYAGIKKFPEISQFQGIASFLNSYLRYGRDSNPRPPA